MTVRNALCKLQFRNYKNGFRRMPHDRAHRFPCCLQFSCELICDRFTGFSVAKPYRCRVCAGKDGFRSHPRTLMERYILPLVLMKPMR